MKYILLVVAAVVIFFGILFYMNKSDETEIAQTPKELESNDFTWTASEVLNQKKINEGSDNIPAYNLTLSAGDESYDINTYLDKNIYGCRNYRSEDIEGIMEQYEHDNSYWPDIMQGAVSSYLCAGMGGGDLFVVTKGYEVKHYFFGDLAEQEPSVLFAI